MNSDQPVGAIIGEITKRRALIPVFKWRSRSHSYLMLDALIGSALWTKEACLLVALKGLVLKATQSLIAVRDVHEHGFDGNGSVSLRCRTRKLAGFIALHEKKKSITRIVALMWWRALRLDNVPTLSAFSIPIAKRRVWESGSWGVRMKDHELVLRALNKAELIVGDYLESGHPRDPVATINRLIEVLDDQMLAAAIKRMENGYGLKLYPILASSQSQRRRSWFQN
jgi:hypothetical protein